MDLLPTGSDELVYIRTDKVNLTIKGPAAHPSFQGVEYREGDSEFKLSCNEEYDFAAITKLNNAKCISVEPELIHGGEREYAKQLVSEVTHKEENHESAE